MKSAATWSISESAVRWLESLVGPSTIEKAKASAERGLVSGLDDRFYELDELATHPACRFSLFFTKEIGPHKDFVVFEHTFGVVLHGNHSLITGSRYKIGELKRGTAYWLNNQKFHAALPIDGGDEPLVFLATDLPAYSNKDALQDAKKMAARIEIASTGW